MSKNILNDVLAKTGAKAVNGEVLEACLTIGPDGAPVCLGITVKPVDKVAKLAFSKTQVDLPLLFQQFQLVVNKNGSNGYVPVDAGQGFINGKEM